MYKEQKKSPNPKGQGIEIYRSVYGARSSV